MRRDRAALVGGAVVIALCALFMPSAWYDALPRQAEMPPRPMSGVLLFRLLLAFEAAVLTIAAVAGWRYVRGPSLDAMVPGLGDREEAGDLSARQATWWGALITLLAIALRLYHADAELWLDEITPLLDYGGLSVPAVIGTYLRSNNHLLNTLLIKGMVAAFGEQAWSVRVPAIAFGVAAVPLVYGCARVVLSRRASLCAALLLAVSYHHIFFSQNARGYTAYLCWALLGTRALIDALRHDRRRSWALFVVATVLGFAALLHAAFVFAAQGLVALGVVWQVRAQGGDAVARWRRVLVVFAIAGLVSLQLYAIALPDVLVVISSVYKLQSTGFVFFSGEFAREMLRGLSDGFGGAARVAAVPVLLVAAAGFLALLRRSWVLAAMLVLPGVLTGTFLVVRGLTVSPRFFLLWLPLTAITAVVALDAAIEAMRGHFRGHFRGRLRGRLGERLCESPALAQRVLVGSVAGMALLSLASLQRYYAIPKQPYREAIAYIEQHRAPADPVIVLYLGEFGVRYHGARMGAPLESRYHFVRTMPALEAVMASRGTGHVWVLTTFERALRMDLPDIDGRLRRDWVERALFPGTIGDGGVRVWTEANRRADTLPAARQAPPRR